MLLVPIPWAGRVWALPFLSALAPSERYAQERGKKKPHKKLTDWARQDAPDVSATRTRRVEGTRAGSEYHTEPPWNVVLHNDFHNPINRVVWRLWRTIPDMTMKRATKVTWEAHTKGRAVAKTCHRELAELYEERLRATGLTVSVELAD